MYEEIPGITNSKNKNIMKILFHSKLAGENLFLISSVLPVSERVSK